VFGLSFHFYYVTKLVSTRPNILCTNKDKFDEDQAKKDLKQYCFWGKVNVARDWAYRNIKNRIVAESFIEDKSNKDGSINDYKFFCFNGRVEFVAVDVGRFGDHWRNLFDRDGQYIPKSYGYPGKGKSSLTLPDNYSEMVCLAEIFAKHFPFVRVDFYDVEGKRIVFGELTFYPHSGYGIFYPDQFDLELGEKFNLPAKRC
jgi:hypothetical protein